MAVYQGARPRGLGGGSRALLAGSAGLAAGQPAIGRVAPGIGVRSQRAAGATAIPRRARRRAIRAGRTSAPVGTLLAAIIVVFVLAFFSLAQTVRVSASNYEVDRLTVQQERLQERERELESDINRLGSEPAIRKLAFDAGLGQLQAPVVLPAR